MGLQHREEAAVPRSAAERLRGVTGGLAGEPYDRFVPESRALEGRIVAFLARVFPEQSQPRLIVGDLLDDAPETEPGEAKFVADAHSVIFSIVAGVASLPAIAAMAGLDHLFGHETARRAGAILLAPTAFFMALGVLVQLAKFRGRFDGVQPHLGRGSWAVCIAVVTAVALYLAAG